MSEEIKNPKVGGVKIAEVPKEQLRLPQLHFITAMDWIDKLGETAFCAYLKLFTLADRKGKSLKTDEAKIKDSLANVQKQLGVSKGTFYNKVIKPLWNHNLIDLETYEESKMKKNAQKPVNIVVYPYPDMKFDNMVKPLEKLRDYDNDYNSEARIHARKKPKKTEVPTVQNLDGIENGDSRENIELDTVQNLDGGPSKNRTGARLKFEPNNLRSNSFKNGFNSFKNKKQEEEEEAPALLHNPSLKLLNDLAIASGFDAEVAMELVISVNDKKINNLTEAVILKAFEEVQADIASGFAIGHMAKWTAGKIEKVSKRKNLNVKPSNPKQPEGPKKPKVRYGTDPSQLNFKPVRTEILPEWYEEENPAFKTQQQSQSFEENKRVIEEKKRAIEEKLKSFREVPVNG